MAHSKSSGRLAHWPVAIYLRLVNAAGGTGMFAQWLHWPALLETLASDPASPSMLAHSVLDKQLAAHSSVASPSNTASTNARTFLAKGTHHRHKALVATHGCRCTHTHTHARTHLHTYTLPLRTYIHTRLRSYTPAHTYGGAHIHTSAACPRATQSRTIYSSAITMAYCGHSVVARINEQPRCQDHQTRTTLTPRARRRPPRQGPGAVHLCWPGLRQAES